MKYKKNKKQSKKKYNKEITHKPLKEYKKN